MNLALLPSLGIIFDNSVVPVPLDYGSAAHSGMGKSTLGEKIGTTFSKNSFHAAYSIKRTSPHDASNMLKRG